MVRKTAVALLVILCFLLVASCGADADIVIHTNHKPTESVHETTGTIQREDGRIDVVVNKNSMVFHFPNCIYVSTIAEKNRMDMDVESIEYLTSHGYTPCSKCAAQYKESTQTEE